MFESNMYTGTQAMHFYKAQLLLLITSLAFLFACSRAEPKEDAAKTGKTETPSDVSKAKKPKKQQIILKPQVPAPPKQRGAALGLYSEDPDWSYKDMLREMKDHGVSHVAIVVPWYMNTARDEEIFKHPRFTVPMSTLKRTIRDTNRLGMKVLLFPILRVEHKTPELWRGTLDPEDLDLFFDNYKEFILGFAKVAKKHRVPIMSVGSELASMEEHEQRWRQIIAAVKEVYKGELLYSANWDHYDKVPFWDALDYVGITGYFELAEPGDDPSVGELVNAWNQVRGKLLDYAEGQKKPLILTEVGYLSQKDTAAAPWKEEADEELDLDIQRRCYEAFRRSWNGKSILAGAYFWNWFGWGGDTSKEYTPRGKPAAEEVAKWYQKKHERIERIY